jgi:hypothetical protein
MYTHSADEFRKANDKSPVVQGSVIGRGGQGGAYVLDDGTTMVISAEECKKLPSGYPKWRGI